MDFSDLLEYCQIQAIADLLEPTELSVWESICRSYSQKFSTSLHLCLDGTIPAQDILKAEFSDQLKDFDIDKDLEHLLDKIYLIEDPNYEAQKRKEVKDFMKQVEKEEEERLKAGKPIHPAMKEEGLLKNTSVKPEEPPANLPTGGKLNLSYLEKEENPFSHFEE